MRCKFWTNCSLFLISTLHIIFIEKIHSTTISQQPIWQIICNSGNKNSTHTLESFLIFLESNYKLVPWLKKFQKVYSSSFICASSGISILIKCNVAVNSISISHQNSIAKTPFTYFISLRRWVFFFLWMLN